MGIACWITLDEKDRQEYIDILNSIIGLAQHELAVIQDGGISNWDAGQLESVIIPEMHDLLQHALRGELYLKYGKQERLLVSTYILTDSLNAITYTPLGRKICELQDKIDGAGDGSHEPC